jgi:hypothetical protein
VQTDMGGASAPTGVEKSVHGLKQRIAELSLKSSGHFLDYKGQEIGW